MVIVDFPAAISIAEYWSPSLPHTTGPMPG